MRAFEGDVLTMSITQKSFMQTFEVVIYNEKVRQPVSQGDSHRTCTDEWGDSHYIESRAESEEQAVAKCRQKYPEADGVVIEGVTPVS